MQEANGGAQKRSLTFFNGIKPILSQNASNSFISAYAKFSAIQSRLNTSLSVYSGAPRFLIEPVLFAAVILYVVYLTSIGESVVDKLPELGVFALAGYRLIPAFQLLYLHAARISGVSFSVDEIYGELSDLSDSSTELSTVSQDIERLPFEKSIILNSIHFTYPGAGKAVFSGLNLTVRKGEAVALVGESGAGKSTLIDMLLGLHIPSLGSIIVDNQKLQRSNILSWRALVGYVAQDVYLTDDSVASNILFGEEFDDSDRQFLRDCCRQAQILNFIENELPEGFETIVGERGVRLSGGQRQRIGLARALYRRPSVLILDEATSALDNEMERLVVDAIDNLKGEITMIIVAHRETSIENVDVLYSLGNGRAKRLK